MTAGMIDVLEIVAFALVGGGSFMAGYLSRYLFSDDYDRGYQEGYDYGRRYHRAQDTIKKLH